MGVPGLFSWIYRRCPETVQNLPTQKKGLNGISDGCLECDNLYIDLNHIIHACTRAASSTAPSSDFFGAVCGLIKEFIEKLVEVARPRRVLFLAVDGVAPRAKMNQQRTRRFLSAYMRKLSAQFEDEIRREMCAEAEMDLKIPVLPDFDSNAISPGTPFMQQVSDFLAQFVQDEIAANALWKDLMVMVSNASEPGEGEHKIMTFIRHQREQPEYNPNTKHVVYGQDADLILLSLLTHEPHFSIIREDMQSGKRTGKHFHNFLKFDVGIFRRYLRSGLQDFSEMSNVGESVQATDENAFLQKDGDFERILEDFVFLTLLVGNDFAPAIPSLDIYDRPHGGLDLVMRSYKELRDQQGGFITNQGVINPAKLKKILKSMAKDEESAYFRSERQRQRAHKRLMDEVAKLENEKDDDCFSAEGWVSVGEIHPGTALDDALGMLVSGGNLQHQGQDLRNLCEDELLEEFLGRIKKRVTDKVMGGKNADPLRMTCKGYRSRYYEVLFNSTSGIGVEDMARKVSLEYVNGLFWIMAYYTRGPNPVATTESSLVFNSMNYSEQTGKKKKKGVKKEGPLYAAWDWFYPFYYAPLMQDLVDHTGELSASKSALRPGALDLHEYSIGLCPDHGPALPLIQLMSIIPPQSACACLPQKLANILTSTCNEIDDGDYNVYAGTIKHMFPEEMGQLIDARGKMWAHRVVVKLPFSDPRQLAETAMMASADEQELTEDEEERNTFQACQLFTHAAHPFNTVLDALINESTEQRSLECKTAVEHLSGSLNGNSVNWGNEDGEAGGKVQEEAVWKLQAEAMAKLVLTGDLSEEEEEEEEGSCTEENENDNDNENEDDDGNGNVVSCLLDIAGASANAFSPELLPGVQIEEFPIHVKLFSDVVGQLRRKGQGKEGISTTCLKMGRGQERGGRGRRGRGGPREPKKHCAAETNKGRDVDVGNGWGWTDTNRFKSEDSARQPGINEWKNTGRGFGGRARGRGRGRVSLTETPHIKKTHIQSCNRASTAACVDQALKGLKKEGPKVQHKVLQGQERAMHLPSFHKVDNACGHGNATPKSMDCAVKDTWGVTMGSPDLIEDQTHQLNTYSVSSPPTPLLHPEAYVLHQTDPNCGNGRFNSTHEATNHSVQDSNKERSASVMKEDQSVSHDDVIAGEVEGGRKYMDIAPDPLIFALKAMEEEKSVGINEPGDPVSGVASNQSRPPPGFAVRGNAANNGSDDPGIGVLGVLENRRRGR